MIRQIRSRETVPTDLKCPMPQVAPNATPNAFSKPDTSRESEDDSSRPLPFTLELLVGTPPHISTIILHQTMQEEQANRIATYLRQQCGLPPEHPNFDIDAKPLPASAA
jgi:hypothetical protein